MPDHGLNIADLGFGPYPHDEPSQTYPVYTRGNAGEVYPEVVYPFGFSLTRLIDDPFRRTLIAGRGLAEADFANERDAGVVSGAFSGYAYLNLSLTRRLAARAPGVTPEEVDAAMLGSEAGAPPHVAAPGERRLRRTLGIISEGLKGMRATALPELDADKEHARQLRRDGNRLTAATDDELVARITDLLPIITEMFERHLAVSGHAGSALVLLRQQVDKILGDPAAAMTLLSGIGDIESADPARKLWDLSRLDAGGAEFDRRFAEFLDLHGSRGPNEWEIACPTWGTNPDLALALVDRLRAADDSQAPSTRDAGLADTRAEALDRVYTAAGRMQRSGFDRLLRFATLYSQGRERAKTTVINVIHQQRLAALELGRRLAERAGNPDQIDLWFCYQHELDELRADPAGFAATAAGRRATRDELAARIPPFVFDGKIPPPTEWQRRDDQKLSAVAAGTELSGTPGGSGTATGIARIVNDPSQEADLGPGTILVAPHTDPAWTPLFLGVDAVVVNVGGQVSHAVIVARELGLPCVVGVEDATLQIPDGATISVDGDTGTVRVERV
jgi:pyruvate,water dikinase